MKEKTGYIYLTFVFFTWGSLYVVSKYAMASVPPITILLFRDLIGMAVLSLLAKKVGYKRIKKEHIKYFIAMGALGYAASQALLFIGTKLMDASLSSLFNTMNTVAITILAAIFLKEKITIRKIICIMISIFGVFVILGIGSGDNNILGVMAVSFSILLWSATSIMVRKISGEYNPVLIVLYSIMISVVFLFPASMIELQYKTCTFTIPAILSILYLGVVCTALAQSLWNKSLSMIDASTCSMFYPLQPLTSAVLGIILLHEELSLNFVIGGILISAGIVISLVRVKESKGNKAE